MKHKIYKDITWLSPTHSREELPTLDATVVDYFASMYIGLDEELYGLCYIFENGSWSELPINLIESDPSMWVASDYRKHTSWEQIAKRLLSAMFYGVSIIPDSGNRRVVVDLKSTNFPDVLKIEYENINHSSVEEALDYLDDLLESNGSKNTSEAFKNFLDKGKDLCRVFE